MKESLDAAYRLAESQGWVASRTQLTALGVTRWMVRDRLAKGAWVRWGVHTVGLRRGDLSGLGRLWRAVWESGRVSALDGVSALVVAGLTGFDVPEVHVSVPHGRAPRQVDGVRRHVVALRRPGELLGGGLPRTTTAVAVIRGAQWASSDRQAALLLVMSAQQRLLPLARMQDTLDTWRPHRRRALIRTVLNDVIDGAQALGELDVGALCRRHGLPAPHRQVVRRGPSGRIYLDLGWPDIGLFVEIDGIHHVFGDSVVVDALRQNSVVLSGGSVLRIPLLGLRLQESAFMGQVVTAYWMRSRRAA
ncbi:hypothetical protein [Luteipulveratus flavus]|uniref:DUF559 domain-containing protein n=1 Tax=Luteipulveratus flavus TaxID=3031728 RepID=A0ABT6C3H5_9MICO|nr:hypothetical protein [Luteipulveratus sp. YIM 133296]MDF8263348.1 hypothetical protein [Luteipulveratus sp. YIM 133296]